MIAGCNMVNKANTIREIQLFLLFAYFHTFGRKPHVPHKSQIHFEGDEGDGYRRVSIELRHKYVLISLTLMYIQSPQME